MNDKAENSTLAQGPKDLPTDDRIIIIMIARRLPISIAPVREAGCAIRFRPRMIAKILRCLALPSKTVGVVAAMASSKKSTMTEMTSERPVSGMAGRRCQTGVFELMALEHKIAPIKAELVGRVAR